MSPFRRKAVENALIAVLRDAGGSAASMKEIRPKLAAMLDGPLALPEIAGAVQSLRYQAKLEWDAIALSESMKIKCAGVPVPAPEAGAAQTTSPASNSTAAGPDDDDSPEDDYPGEVNDTADWDACPVPSLGPGKVPGGWTKAANIAGARPLPAPAHEPEVARQVREECNLNAERRRRARSTGTVRQPLELRKFGVADMDLAEGVSSLLVEQPHDLMAAISRKHPALWKRVLQLGRAAGKRPAEALYDALERGLDELEQGELSNAA